MNSSKLSVICGLQYGYGAVVADIAKATNTSRRESICDRQNKHSEYPAKIFKIRFKNSSYNYENKAAIDAFNTRCHCIEMCIIQTYNSVCLF